MTQPFIVLADRGRLRMFAVQTDGSHQNLRSLADTELVGPGLKAGEKYTDKASSRDNPGDGMKFGSTNEHMGIGLEEEKRLLTHIGQSINALLHEHGAERWMFAAPSEINAAILANVDGELKARLEENLKLDLVNVETANLARHFHLDLSGAATEVRR